MALVACPFRIASAGTGAAVMWRYEADRHSTNWLAVAARFVPSRLVRILTPEKPGMGSVIGPHWYQQRFLTA
ncbi:hypothetical protein BO94DRAFT_537759 [Aspergillus sclerotioniger CBS 115572]|uniref:Uncharacterized protein n=1 Tax=Aspergillus sclerotioniger CBS 115572 TaxID=1450535 RepID=A0A317VXP4_9EURO|nr:hypothetical protein BO94DRAFT_537759 [Aspergillus sclerotioniger CBS 115572]PWY78565.1 hypothetical protein BO94DRAFT_537759 [Aspergillus sclerotioniger CBS 115572]